MSTKVPNCGWKVKFNHSFPEKRNQFFIPSFKILFNLFTLLIRYTLYMLWCYIRKKKPVMDYIKVVEPKQMYGVPLGGIGGGTIGRGFKGEFCRFQLKPGIYEYEIIDADQFIVTVQNTENVTVYQNVLSTNNSPCNGHLNSWKWNFPAENSSYTALYPRSWTEYFIPQCNIKLICRQISPIIPGNYKDSSFPGGVFVWTVMNFNSESLNVTITFTLKGYKKASRCEQFEIDQNKVKVAGMKIYNNIRSMKCTFAFGAKETIDVNVSETSFNPNGSGAVVWDQLYEKGSFNKQQCSTVQYFSEIACAVAAKTLITKNSSKDLEFVLMWHMPLIQFLNGQKTHERYYTTFFGNDNNAVEPMCHYALSNYQKWEEEIDNWQKPTLNDSSLPEWYKSAVFNELYFISDGGTIWIKIDDDEYKNFSSTDPRKKYGRFAYLEGHEYRMYNTYDVHFYASFALIDLWPQLQLSIQYEFRDTVTRADNSFRWILYNGYFGCRKELNCIPHDIGDPEEEPFLKINSYPVHKISDWKDLNLKFVLQCYRDFTYTNNKMYLIDMWPQVKLLMNTCLAWDTDNDGMIENSGFPDQTYDAWKMTGISAYCGGLWLAALCVTVKMASILQDNDTEKKFSHILENAKVTFNRKLWNGSYYDFDTGREINSKSIMADQLCGIWYLQACGITDEILPQENIKKSLYTVFEYNVKRFKNGESGAVNGMLPNGVIDKSSIQSQEVWTGVSYAIASHLIFQGMKEEGFQTAEGIYETVYNKIGSSFETPEALYEKNCIRSVGYMRPLSVWSIQIALKKLKND